MKKEIIMNPQVARQNAEREARDAYNELGIDLSGVSSMNSLIDDLTHAYMHGDQEEASDLEQQIKELAAAYAEGEE